MLWVTFQWKFNHIPQLCSAIIDGKISLLHRNLIIGSTRPKWVQPLEPLRRVVRSLSPCFIWFVMVNGVITMFFSISSSYDISSFLTVGTLLLIVVNFHLPWPWYLWWLLTLACWFVHHKFTLILDDLPGKLTFFRQSLWNLISGWITVFYPWVLTGLAPALLCETKLMRHSKFIEVLFKHK